MCGNAQLPSFVIAVHWTVCEQHKAASVVCSCARPPIDLQTPDVQPTMNSPTWAPTDTAMEGFKEIFFSQFISVRLVTLSGWVFIN